MTELFFCQELFIPEHSVIECLEKSLLVALLQNVAVPGINDLNEYFSGNLYAFFFDVRHNFEYQHAFFGKITVTNSVFFSDQGLVFVVKVLALNHISGFCCHIYHLFDRSNILSVKLSINYYSTDF